MVLATVQNRWAVSFGKGQTDIRTYVHRRNICPPAPTLYFTLVTNRGFTGNYWQMYPTYLNHVISYGFNIKSPFFFGIWPGHLWFLQFLFIMSVVLLPLLLFLRSERGNRLVQWLAGVCARPGGIFLFLIPLAGVRILFKHIFPGDKTWADLIYYAVFFLVIINVLAQNYRDNEL